MLFLAVFCGFLAENIREHKVEQQRAKALAKNLYKEIYADSIAVQQKIAIRNKKEEECLDHVYVGIYTPHSWWGASGMPFAKDIKAGDTIIIEVTGKSSFRIDLDCEEIK